MANTETNQADDDPKTLKQKIIKEAKEWGATLSVFIPLYLIFSGIFYELRVIPSESMVPTLQVGDRVAVNKFAYGWSRYSVPFSLGRYLPLPEGRFWSAQPERGDVVVFEHPHLERVMIKRLIGVPGDRVYLRDGQIFLNGEPVARDFVRRINYREYDSGAPIVSSEYKETIEGRSWTTHDREGATGKPDTNLFIVPDGHFLFMGDNRDNSLDGRAVAGHCEYDDTGAISEAGCGPRRGVPESRISIGYVPFEKLIGRADTVLFTTYSCDSVNAQPCMQKRLWSGM